MLAPLLLSMALAPANEPRFIDRNAPEPMMFEAGVYGGVFLPSRHLELFEPDETDPDQGFSRFAPVAPDFGGRLGVYPLRHLGLELEGGAMPSRTNDGRALLWAARGHLIAQVGLWRIVPFALVGGGVLGVASGESVVGRDVDAALHVGLGAKLHAHRLVALRLDLRDVISARAGVEQGLTSSFEVLLGLSITFGRKPKPAPTPKPVVQAEPAPAPAPEPAPALEVPPEVARWSGVIEGIHFDHDSAVVNEGSRPTLDEAARVLAEHPEIRVRIVGHTDTIGSWAYNVDLSQRRADAVAAYLVAAGIDAARIETAGLGPARPRADNATEQGRARNRRIEFELMLETAP